MLNEGVNIHNPKHQRLLFQLMRANVQLFGTLNARNEGDIPFEIPTSTSEKRLS